MSASGQEAANFPTWMLYFAFWASVILTIFKIVELAIKASIKAKLEIVLTKEVFFRIADYGEVLYANAVLVANDANAMITGIKASLKKTNGATKAFDLEIAQLGEKARDKDGNNQYYFHSTSPLAIIPENNVQRQVYIFQHESYAENTKKEFLLFKRNLLAIHNQYDYNNTTYDEMDEASKLRLEAELEDTIKNCSQKIMDTIQIEPGNYTLSLTVDYRPLRKSIWRVSSKKTISTIEFVVEGHAKDYMRTNLEDYLKNWMLQYFTKSDRAFSWPEYSPVEVKELHE